MVVFCQILPINMSDISFWLFSAAFLQIGGVGYKAGSLKTMSAGTTTASTVSTANKTWILEKKKQFRHF